MRKLYFFPILAIAIVSCKSSNPEMKKINMLKEKTELEVDSKYRGSYFHENDNDTSAFFLFDVILTNYTKKEVEFWTLTCTPQANVVINSDLLNFFIPQCYGNGPRLIKLSPNQQFVVPIVLQVGKHDKNGLGSQFSFGFIINKPKYKLGLNKTLDYAKDPFRELVEMRRTKENTIWSKSFDIFGDNYFLYEIRNIINDSTYSSVPRQRLIEGNTSSSKQDY